MSSVEPLIRSRRQRRAKKFDDDESLAIFPPTKAHLRQKDAAKAQETDLKSTSLTLTEVAKLLTTFLTSVNEQYRHMVGLRSPATSPSAVITPNNRPDQSRSLDVRMPRKNSLGSGPDSAQMGVRDRSSEVPSSKKTFLSMQSNTLQRKPNPRQEPKSKFMVNNDNAKPASKVSLAKGPSTSEASTAQSNGVREQPSLRTVPPIGAQLGLRDSRLAEASACHMGIALFIHLCKLKDPEYCLKETDPTLPATRILNEQRLKSADQ